MKRHVTYANVVATLALFVALGGSSYAAATLARDSVGPKQVRARAIGPSELRRDSVSARAVRNGSLSLRELSPAARGQLRGLQGPPGQQGPTGPAGTPYFANVDAGAGQLTGNATGASWRGGDNPYRVSFGRSLDGCVATATVANAAPEGEPDTGGAYATVGRQGDEVVVRTYAANGERKPFPFNVLMTC